MIKEPGAVTDEFKWHLDYLARDAEYEATDDGFDYTVYDPDRLERSQADSLVIGAILTKAEEVEVDLFISASIPSATRQKLAEIIVEESWRSGRYALPFAADTILGMGSNPDRDFYEGSSDVLRYMQRNLEGYRYALQTRRQRGEAINPAFADAIRSAIGWVNFRRPLSPRGEHAYDALSKEGLVIPDFETGQWIVGLMKTKKSGLVKAGFVSMPERSERHTCATCTGQVLFGTHRTTLQLDENRGYSDHHHYHSQCFIEKVLPKFKLDSLGLDTNPEAER